MLYSVFITLSSKNVISPIGAFEPDADFKSLGEATISFNLCLAVLSHYLIILLHHSSETSAVAYMNE